MTTTTLLLLAAAGLVIASFAASAAKILHEFARHELEHFCLKRDRYAVYDQIIEHREQLAWGAETLQLIGLAIASIGGLVAAQQAGYGAPASGWELTGWITAFALLLLASNSWIPWAMLNVAPSRFLFFTWRFWWGVTIAFKPMMVGFKFFTELFRRISGTIVGHEDEEEAFEEEIRSMVSEAERDGFLDFDAREMIEGVIELDDKDVGEVMTPRKDIIALPADIEWDDMIQLVVQHNKTRIPVYEGELNNIIGFLHTKDLLRETIKPPHERRSLQKLLRPATFVPESMLVDELLQQFREKRKHMAIIVDEYGSVAGLVTIEDILEEIVGDIIDETEPEPAPIYRRLNEHTIQAIGSTKIERLNDEFGWELPEDLEFDTIGGLMMHQLKEIPENHTTLIFGNLELEAIGNHRRIIERVNIRVLTPEELNGDYPAPSGNSKTPSHASAATD